MLQKNLVRSAAMIDHPAGILLHILQSTLHLISHYSQREEGPMMRELKLALERAIAEFEAAGADQPAPMMPRTAAASWRYREKPLDKSC
jgi:hypothetical protein